MESGGSTGLRTKEEILVSTLTGSVTMDNICEQMEDQNPSHKITILIKYRPGGEHWSSGS